MQLDLYGIAFADRAGAGLRIAQVNRLLETGEVLLRQVDHGLRQQHGHELLGDVESECPLVIGHLRARDRGLILRRLQPVLALLAALEGVADAQVELGAVVDVRPIELVEVEEREELRIPGERGIRPQVGGNFLGLVLTNGGAGRFERMVVLQARTGWPAPE